MKRFGIATPAFQDTSRWQKRGNVYTLKRAPDLDKDRWVTNAQFKALNKLEAGEKLRIAGTANANITDRVQERLDPRGLDATDYLRNAQLLAHHNYYCPVGQVETLDIQDSGVDFHAWVGDPVKVGGPQHLTEMQKEIRSLVAQDILKAVSVGFIPKKFRAPLYNDNGDMEEPLVIESWELLELSIVAVPCNQLSLFQMRDAQQERPEKRIFAVPFNANGGDPLKFLKENFTKEELNSLILKETTTGAAELSDENDDSEEEIDDVATKTRTNGNGGGKASSSGSSSKGSKGESSDDEDEEEDYDEGKAQKEMLTLIRQMNAGQGKTLELLGDMMKHLLKKEAAGGESEDEEEEEEKDSEEIADVKSRIEALEDGQKEIVGALKSLADAIKSTKK